MYVVSYRMQMHASWWHAREKVTEEICWSMPCRCCAAGWHGHLITFQPATAAGPAQFTNEWLNRVPKRIAAASCPGRRLKYYSWTHADVACPVPSQHTC